LFTQTSKVNETLTQRECKGLLRRRDRVTEKAGGSEKEKRKEIKFESPRGVWIKGHSRGGMRRRSVGKLKTARKKKKEVTSHKLLGIAEGLLM